MLEFLSSLSPLSAALLTILTSICATFLIAKFWRFWKVPGPWGLPFIGYYPFIREDFYNHLHELTKKYGDVYTINICGTNFVYIGNVKALKEANVTRQEDFAYRTQKYNIIKQMIETGLVLMAGEPWVTHRKFFVQCLREAGLQTRDKISKGPMGDAVIATLEEFRKTDGEAFLPISILVKQTNAVLQQVMVGDEITENQLKEMNNNFMKMSKMGAGLNLMLVGELARLYFLPRAPGFSDMIEGTEGFKALLSKIVQEHKKTFDPDQEPRDFVDFYLRERAIREKKNDPMAKTFTDESLTANLRQAYADGSFSVAMFMLSFMWQMSRYRDAQEAIYKEIVEVVGTERAPTLDDRSELPLIQSAFKELLRTTKFMTMMHSLEANKDTEVCGVRIPKGYITLVNFWAINRDPDVYEDPYKFDVTRFLPEKGKVEPPITFGVGRRSCVAEVFVMNEMFLFVTAILQNFILIPENEVDESKPVLDLRVLLDCKIRAIPRKRKDSVET